MRKPHFRLAAARHRIVRSRYDSRPGFEALESRRLLAISWDGGGDGSSWSDAANWMPNRLPVLEDDVVIDLPGRYQVNLDIETPALNSFILDSVNATLAVSDQFVNINGHSEIRRGTLLLEDAGWQGQQPITNLATIRVVGQTTIRTPLFASHADGTISGPGTLNLVGSSVLGGIIEPSLLVSHGTLDIARLAGSIGRLEIAKDFVLGDSSVLHFELGGVEPGVNADVLTIGGKVALGGTIHVSLTGGFLPDPCQQFVAIQSAGLPSSPSTAITGLNLPRGMALRPAWSPSGLTLAAYRQAELINVFPTDLTVSEGGAARAYQICLGGANPPDGLVEIVATSDRQVSVSPPSVRFDPASIDWHSTKAFTVSAADDVAADGDRRSVIRLRAKSADPRFDSTANPHLIRDVNVFARDNDIPADRFEPSDSGSKPADIGSSDQTHTGLTIHQPADEDWFEWTAPSRGTLAVSVFFEQIYGDLELWVYRDENVEVFAGTQTDNEHVTLPVLSGEKLGIRVFGMYGATNPNYDLIVRMTPDEPRVYIGVANQIHYYDFAGNQLGVVQHPILSSGTLGDIEIGSNGLVYASVNGVNLIGDSILEFTPNGMFSRAFSVPPETTRGPLPYPYGFDVLDDDTFLVAQPNDGKIVQVGRRGRVIATHQQEILMPQDATVLSDGSVVWSDHVQGASLINAVPNRRAWLALPQTHAASLIDHMGTQLASRLTNVDLFPIEAQEAADKSLFVVSGSLGTTGSLTRYGEAGQLMKSIDVGFPTGMAILGADRPSRVPITDEDGDGLSDRWETSGIDINGDGMVDLDLPALGANPHRKDLFVEVDAMFGRGPLPLPNPITRVVDQKLNTNTILDRVIAAFLDAPLPNPDGSTGINLHVLLDETTIPLEEFSTPWSEFSDLKSGSDSEYRDGKFGTTAERDSDNWAHIRETKGLVYRYGLFADRIGDEPVSGIAELPGDDFIVALGGSTVPGGSADEQAGTFMHELGHTLGLRHGGGDNINFKPNYVSVMNDHWRVPGQNAGWSLDYSRGELPALDETRLNESRGVGFPDTDPKNGRAVQAGPLPFQSVPLSGPVDWNRDGRIARVDLVRVDINRGFADVNRDGLVNPLDEHAEELLKGHDDWSNLRFSFTDLQNAREYAEPDLDHAEHPDSGLDDLYDNYPRDFADDSSIGNDSAGTAFQLDSLDLIFGLTIDVPSDVDWFTWTAAASGPLKIGVDTSFDGTFELRVFSDARAELGRVSNGADDGFEQVGISVEKGQTYFIQLFGLESDEGLYNLFFNAGDFDQDNDVDVDDISALCQNPGPNRRFDLNGDSRATDADLSYLVRSILSTSFGDANLDGVFDSADLIRVFQSGQYEDDIADNSSWASGDWNCDGDFDSSDLIKAFSAGTYVAAAEPLMAASSRIDETTARPQSEGNVFEERAVRDAVFADVAFRLAETEYSPSNDSPTRQRKMR